MKTRNIEQYLVRQGSYPKDVDSYSARYLVPRPAPQETPQYANSATTCLERVLRLIYNWGFGSPVFLAEQSHHNLDKVYEALKVLEAKKYIQNIGTIKEFAQIYGNAGNYYVRNPGFTAEIPLNFRAKSWVNRQSDQHKFASSRGFYAAKHAFMVYNYCSWLNRLIGGCEVLESRPLDGIIYPETVLRQCFGWYTPASCQDFPRNQARSIPDRKAGSVFFATSVPDAWFVSQRLQFRIEVQLCLYDYPRFQRIISAVPDMEPILYMVPANSPARRRLLQFEQGFTNLCVITPTMNQRSADLVRDYQRLLFVLGRAASIPGKTKLGGTYSALPYRYWWQNLGSQDGWTSPSGRKLSAVSLYSDEHFIPSQEATKAPEGDYYGGDEEENYPEDEAISEPDNPPGDSNPG